MPKIVDPDQRRKDVFDALFAVIVEHGVAGASLRRVADQAGLAIGSVRHYFDSHEAMLRGAAKEVIDRLTARLEAHRATLADTADRPALTELMIGELLPLNARSTQETTVWLEFAMAARITPAFRDTADQLHTGVRALAATLLRARQVPAELVEVEAERLAALIDGLALAGTLHPDTLSVDLARAVVHRHLATIAPDQQGNG